MCIIVYKPKGINLKKETYDICFENNPDGAGFLIREKSGELIMEKGFFTFEEFWTRFQPHQHKQALVHFRITTHGKTDATNCHPFWVNENEMAFAHNGIMSNVDCKSDKNMSDTWHFNASILQRLKEKLGNDFIYDETIQELISSYIGGGNKLVFLEKSGRSLIFNKSRGEMDQGAWFSNWSYKNRWNNKQNYHAPEPRTYEMGNKDKKLLTDQSCNATILHPVVPFTRKGPPLNSTIRLDDYVELLEPYADLRGNEVGLVKGFLQHGMIQVKIYDPKVPTNWKIRALPAGTFQKYCSAINPATGEELISANDLPDYTANGTSTFQ